jgi:5-formyltetrahydrofolate cyclo-ligase
MEMVVSREKKELRQQLLSRLLSLTESEARRRSNNVGENLSNLPIYKKAKVIAVYYPLRGEVDILEMIRKDIAGKRFCFPVMELAEKRLRFFEVNNLDADFVQGPFGVREPDTEKTKAVDIGEIDMVIVPGIAFDRQHNRLGRGVGFYDRFLETLTHSTAKIGIAFEFQLLDDLPIHLQHDRKVDLIVSEGGVI